MAKNKLVVTKKAESVLFNQEYTGFDFSLRDAEYPPVVNVLQSDKQFKAFPSAKNSELVDHYGKLFIRTDNNKPKDLKKTITGTVIKIEQGHEVRDPSTNKIISSDSEMLSKEEKQEYWDKDMKPTNMVKILLAFGTAEKVKEQLAVYNKKMEDGTATREDFPFGVVVIKGTSWGSWLDAIDTMDSMAKESLQKGYKEVLSTVFTFEVGSKEETSSFGDYFSVTVTPDFNSMEEATAFAPLMLEMKEIGLFYKVEERIGQEEDKEVVDKVFEGMETKAEKVDGKDLPF